MPLPPTEAVTIAGTQVKGFEHLMGTPVLIGEKVTGLMAIWRTGEGLEFIQSELDYLKSLAQQAAIAIENARLFKNVTDSQIQLSEALRIARIGYFEIALHDRNITLTDEFFSLSIRQRKMKADTSSRWRTSLKGLCS